MKKEIKDIKSLTNTEEMKKSLSEAQKALLNLRIENRLRKLKNVKSINLKRKEIALLKTKISEKELTKNAR